MKTGRYRGLRAGTGALSGSASAPDGASAGGNAAESGGVGGCEEEAAHRLGRSIDRVLVWSMQPHPWEGNQGLNTLWLPSSLSLPLISC